MKTIFTDAKVIRDEKAASKRRFRHILVNSGEIMENGEARDLSILHVMGRDGKLINVNDLERDPEAQTRDYYVAAATNHGHVDPATGERSVETEDIIGDCKVWMEEDGLHANFYFANDDEKADHAYAVSDNASYSMGTEWYDDGYYGADNEIDEPIGILREISMVATGNDPRAMTIDHKPTEAQAHGRAEAENGNNKIMDKETRMNKKLDKLTPDEAGEMADEMIGVISKYMETETESTDAEGENQNKTNEDEAAEKAGEEAKAAEQDAVKNIAKRSGAYSSTDGKNIVIFEKGAFGTGVKQDNVKSVATTDWRTTKEAKRKFADIAYRNGGFKGRFDMLWANELEKHGAATNDGITGLGLPVDGEQIVIEALEKSEGIINHFDFIGGKTYLVKLISAAEGNNAESARAGGHLKGDTKLFQQLKSDPRQFYTVPVYKKLDLDYLEIYENPELIDVRARELVQARIVEIERAMLIGDGRTAPAEGAADRRMFRNGRGFYSIVADAATSGIGQLFATNVTVPAGSNMVDASILAENALRAEGERIMVAKKSRVTEARLARLGANNTGDYLIPRGSSVEAAFGVSRIYTPAWMDYATCDFIIFVNKTPKMIGKAPASPDMKAFFDTTNDTDVLMAEGPNGGGLAAYKAAAVVTLATE